MIHSMTGFGKSQGNVNDILVSIEVKALNSKGLDINIRMPSFLREKEVDIRNMISKNLERGKIDVFINLDLPANRKIHTLNGELAKHYATSIKALANELGDSLSADSITSEVLKMPNVLEPSSDEISDNDWLGIQKLIAEAIQLTGHHREQEGASLMPFFEESINQIGSSMQAIIPFEKERVEKIRERILKQVDVLKSDVQLDKNRLEQELIFYIEKFDISEEKQRLSMHLKHFLEEMTDGNRKAKGKKLNFVSQEIGREINTIGSKANHGSIQKHVVQMKDNLEQIKEQLANII